MSCDIKICTNHTGKMEGIKSISTSVLLNDYCQERRKVIGSICSRCYANNMAQMYKSLQQNLEHNTKILTTRVLSFEELPDLHEEEIFRFESFGDLNNMTQLINYFNIARKNPFVRFSLYTKRFGLIREFLRREDVAMLPNLTIVFSSFMLNRPVNISRLGLPHPFFKGQYKVFTVYTKDFILKHPELKINCGARSCNKCRRCYEKNDIQFISEILKSDSEKVAFALDMRDDKKKKEILTKIENILEKY